MIKKNSEYYDILWGICFLIIFNSLLIFASEIPITTQSEKAFVFFLQGREKLEKLELDSASIYFDNAIAEDPSFSIAYLYNAIISKDTSDIKFFLKKAYQCSDTISVGEKLLLEVCSSFLNNNLSDIRNKLVKLINEYPTDKRVYNLAGIYLTMLGDEKSAVEHFKTAIDLDNEYAFAYNNIALSFFRGKEYELALEANNKVIELLPNSSEPLCLKGKILIAMDSFNEAADLFENIYHNDSSCTEAIAYLGHIHLLSGQYDLSRELYKKWELNTKKYAESSYSKYFRALTYIFQDKIDEARLIFINNEIENSKWNLVSEDINYFWHPLITNTNSSDLFSGKSKEEIIFNAINDFEKTTNKLPFLMSDITFLQ